MAGGGESGPTFSPSPFASEFASSFPRRPLNAESDFDITAMIDLVFMMNIFFLVTSLTKAMAEVDLPAAQYCIAAQEDDCVLVVIRTGTDRQKPVVLLPADESAKDISDPEDQVQHVRDAVEKGVREGKTKVLIKAERNVRAQDTVRISSVASSVDGVSLFYAVLEKEKGE